MCSHPTQTSYRGCSPSKGQKVKNAKEQLIKWWRLKEVNANIFADKVVKKEDWEIILDEAFNLTKMMP